MIKLLAWDSDFFGLRIGKVKVDCLNLTIFQKIEEEKKDKGFDLVYLITNKTEEEIRLHFTEKGIFPVDNKVTYHRKVGKAVGIDTSIKTYTGSLSDELKELALISGHLSRFKMDKRLSNRFKDLYTQWIEKSLTGEMADTVFVYDDGKLKGFVTVKNNSFTGQIGLIAVGADYQGEGIGTKLLNAVQQWYFDNAIKNCEVVTQGDNIGACKLYEWNGYKVKQKELIYHL